MSSFNKTKITNPFTSLYKLTMQVSLPLLPAPERLLCHLSNISRRIQQVAILKESDRNSQYRKFTQIKFNTFCMLKQEEIYS